MLALLKKALSDDRLGQKTFAVLLAICFFGPNLPFGSPDQVGYGPRLGAPRLAIPLGTDNLGRSILARCVQGLQNTFIRSSVAVLISATLASSLAMTATYASCVTNEVASRTADILFAFPPVLLGLRITAVLSPGASSAMVVIAAVTFPILHASSATYGRATAQPYVDQLLCASGVLQNESVDG